MKPSEPSFFFFQIFVYAFDFHKFLLNPTESKINILNKGFYDFFFHFLEKSIVNCKKFQIVTKIRLTDIYNKLLEGDCSCDIPSQQEITKSNGKKKEKRAYSHLDGMILTIKEHSLIFLSFNGINNIINISFQCNIMTPLFD